MKKWILVGILVLVLTLAWSMPVLAATTDDVTITATPSYLCMTLTFNDAHDDSWALGTVAESTNGYWWDDEGGAQAAPAEPVGADDCAGILTNCGSIAEDFDAHSHDFTGGVGWTLDAAVGADTIVLKAIVEGDANEAAAHTLTQAGGDVEIVSNLAKDGTKGVDLHIETGTFGDGVAKSGTVTYTCRAVT